MSAAENVAAYLSALDAFYGDEYLGDVIDTADGSPGDTALRLSDLRELIATVGTSTVTEEWRCTYYNPQVEDIFDTEDEAREFGKKWSTTRYWRRTRTTFAAVESEWIEVSS